MIVRTHPRASLGTLLSACLMLTVPCVAQAQATDREALVASLDSAASAWVDNDMVPGVAVAVVQRGVTLIERGYGFADLEWRVPTPADASFEIGSITKQFTSTLVMMLVEEGKLDLDADFTRYIDFDTGGRRIPLRRLLDHTSGIRSYTEMQAFGELTPRKLPRDTLVTLVEQQPFDFEPGTALIYNNSAYFLLGLIIEEVTNERYEDLVAERLFRQVGMKDSYYCSESEMRPNRAHGYDAAGPDHLVRAGYLDHTWPYAAGSLCSTVADLVRWNQALHHGELLSDASYLALTTPMPLEDGTPIRYAMGLGVDAPGGRRTIAHGGGINGFVSDGRYYPDDDLIVIALQNSTGAPIGQLGEALADLVLGPLPEIPDVAYMGDVDEFVGEYKGPARGRPMTIEVSLDDGTLAFAIDGAPASHPKYVDGTMWVDGGTELSFVRKDGAVSELHFDAGGAHYVLKRIS